MKERLRGFLRAHPLLPASLSTGWNLIYALFNGVLGLYYGSAWFLSLCAYYAVLGCMRLSAVTAGRSARRTPETVMRRNGLAMILLALTLSGIMVLTIREQHNARYGLIVMLAIATYTFCLVGWTIRNAVRAHKAHSPEGITLRNISCAAAVGSILSLQRAMLGTFGDAASTATLRMEAATGAGAFLILVCLGVEMVVLSRRLPQE